jgi:hypothetical protein
LVFSFDFSKTTLSSNSRQQLTNILDSVKPGSKAAESRSSLLRLIEAHRFDPGKGLYIPTSSHPQQKGKLPKISERIPPSGFPASAFSRCFFGNALCVPEGYDRASFAERELPRPKHRMANVGLLFVTIEHDCKSIDHLEEVLAWTRGGNGDFSKSQFADVDRELARYKDYRGYSVVFTGNKSVHFDLIFSTRHLENASNPNALYDAHSAYWDAATETFQSLLHPSLLPDRFLRSGVQWRRSPWALRKLEEDDKIILGLRPGTIIPQLVIHETIRTRAPRNSQLFLVPPEFNPTYAAPPKSRSKKTPPAHVDYQELLKGIVECCREEWGEFPEPVDVRPDGGEWIINFRNHAHDKNPSTIVKGQYRRLILNGAHSFTQDFYLPDQLSADELCERLIATPALLQPSASLSSPTELAAKAGRRTSKYIENVQSRFAQPIVGNDAERIISTSRERLRHAIHEARVFERNLLVRSPEGIGKTSALFGEIASEIFDAALSRPLDKQQFACFAFRSTEQAEAKAKEYRESGKHRHAVVLSSFWDHYRKSCAEEKVEPLRQHQFPDHSVNGILGHLKLHQPEVFQSLEERRHSLWRGPSGTTLFDSATTVLFTNHDLAKTWYRSHLTRTWHHPNFLPFANQDYEALRADLHISQIVIDEPEIDKVLHIVPEPLFDLLKSMKRRYPGWSNKNRKERHALYGAEKAAGAIPGKHSFEDIDEAMRLSLDALERVDVNYDAIPFGFDQVGKGIYSAQNGKRFFLSPQDWLTDCKAQLTFLTTEALISHVLIRAFSKTNLIVLDLDAACDLFPIEVPLLFDKRAAADRPGKLKISALADEILTADSDAIIIANGIDGTKSRTKTFQRTKGLNGLEDHNVFVIPTCISPEQYAELNVVGQWLKIPNVVSLFYEDQISQAVGRNRGFRRSRKSTKTAVVSSNRLAKTVLQKCFQYSQARIRLVRTKQKPS